MKKSPNEDAGERPYLFGRDNITASKFLKRTDDITTSFSSQTIDEYAKSLLSLKDDTQAIKSIQEYSATVFRSAYAGEIEYGETQHKQLEDRQGRIDSELKDTRAAIRACPKHVPIASDDRQQRKWEIPDKVKIAFLLAGAATTLLASALTPYTAWSASDIPFISDKPILSAALASIIPLSAVAFEGMANAWDSAAGRKIFRNVIYTVTATSIGALLYQLDSNFGYLFGSTLDIDAIFSDSTSHLMLNQVLAEVAVGSTLLISARNIIEKYRLPQVTTPPELTHLLKTEQALIVEQASVEAELQHVAGALDAIKNQCAIAVMQAEARFRVLRDLFVITA